MNVALKSVETAFATNFAAKCAANHVRAFAGNVEKEVATRRSCHLPSPILMLHDIPLTSLFYMRLSG